MLKIGLTGGIGSGKTTVARIFEVMGVPVYYADTEAKRLMNEHAALRAQIIQEFGERAYTQQQLNRQYLAEIIFSNPEKLKLLNQIVHPVTIQDANAWFLKQQTLYAIKEAALIFESDAHHHLDYVIGVQAPEALRIERVMNRDKIDESAVRQRMKAQFNEDEKMKRCHFVIHNDERTSLIEQVLEIDGRLRKG